MMTDACDRWSELSDRRAMEDALNAEQEAFLSAHVALCPACAAEQQVWEALGGILQEDGVEQSVLPGSTSRLPAQEGGGRVGRARLLSAALGLAAAAVLAFIGVRASNLETEAPAPAEAKEHAAKAKSFAQLLLVSGDVKMDGTAPSAGATLDEADTIETGLGRACLTHGPLTKTCLESGSRGRILEARGAAQRIELFEGKLFCGQSKAAPAAEFEVKTKWGTVVGLGARFVTAFTNDGLLVEVEEGSVRVVPDIGEELAIFGKGSALLSRRGVGKAGTALVAADAAPFRTMDLWDEASLTPVLLNSKPAGAEVLIDGTLRGATPLSMMITRGPHLLNIEKEGFVPAERNIEVRGAERLQEVVELSPVIKKNEGAAPRAASASELVAKAQGERKAGRYADAARTYRSILVRYPSSGEAASTRLSLAELQLSQLGAPAEALEAFRQYLRAGGPLRQEASYGEIRALRALGRTAEARDLSRKFVTTYPDSVQAVSLGRWLGRAPEAEGH